MVATTLSMLIVIVAPASVVPDKIGAAVLLLVTVGAAGVAGGVVSAVTVRTNVSLAVKLPASVTVTVIVVLPV